MFLNSQVTTAALQCDGCSQLHLVRLDVGCRASYSCGRVAVIHVGLWPKLSRSRTVHECRSIQCHVHVQSQFSCDWTWSRNTWS